MRPVKTATGAEIYYTGSYLYKRNAPDLHKNSSSEKLKKDNRGRYLTTKEDNGRHGIGLASVEQALADYNGELFTKYEHGEFQASAVLYSNSVEENDVLCRKFNL